MLADRHDRHVERGLRASGGWEQWSVDLSAYAGQQVEVSIAYVSDWSTQGLGVFIDDVAASTGDDGTTSFEAAWTAGRSPARRPAARPTRTTSPARPRRVPGGARRSRPTDTIYFGFGFEGIATPAARNAVMGAAMGHLLP